MNDGILTPAQIAMFENSSLPDHDFSAKADAPMSGQFTDIASIRRFIEAGNATLTIRSKKTTERFTFKLARPDAETGRERPIWARLLTGSDNVGNYAMVGTFWPNVDASGVQHVRYKHSAKSRMGEDIASVKAIKWLMHRVYICGSVPAPLFDQAEIWHEGSCGRCGRRLTVPESISSGFGPDCIQLVNADEARQRPRPPASGNPF